MWTFFEKLLEKKKLILIGLAVAAGVVLIIVLLPVAFGSNIELSAGKVSVKIERGKTIGVGEALEKIYEKVDKTEKQVKALSQMVHLDKAWAVDSIWSDLKAGKKIPVRSIEKVFLDWGQLPEASKDPVLTQKFNFIKKWYEREIISGYTGDSR